MSNNAWAIGKLRFHYNDVIMSAMAYQITSLAIVYSGADQRKLQCSASQALCAGNSPVNGEFPAQGQVTRKMFPFDDAIMLSNYETAKRLINTSRGVCSHKPISFFCQSQCKISIFYKYLHEYMFETNYCLHLSNQVFKAKNDIPCN